MKKLSIVVASILLLIVSTSSFAETATDSSAINEPITKTSSPSSRLKNPRERKEPLKELIQTNRENLKEKIASSRAQFKEKLSEIKDERKQQIIENIDEKIQTFNKNKTDNFLQALDRLSTLLANFKEKAANAKLSGQNTQAVEKEISEAESSLKIAETAVASQSANDYTFTIEDVETLRQTIGQTVSRFRKDLSSTHKLVMEAKKQVMDVARELAKLRVSIDTATKSAE